MAEQFFKNKIVVIFLMLWIQTAFTHRDHSSSYETSDEIERGDIQRRAYKQEWQYEGLPIEMPKRRVFEDQMDETTAPTTLVTPPNDRRFRRVYNPEETASVEDYPFMAALLVNQQLWCGGVVIDHDKVLTAAHCLQIQYNNRLFREYVKLLTVRVGSSNATSGGEVLNVSEIFFHPNYKRNTLEFNFAVLKLNKNITFGKSRNNVEKIEYSREKFIPTDRKIMFLGWEPVLSMSGRDGQVLLQKLDLPIYDFSDCQDVYGRDLVTRTNFCAGYITVPKTVCNHDAGGPAIMNGKLIGILSFSSKRCDQPDQPAVFSTVGAVISWLEKL